MPTLAGNSLYFGSYDGNIYALDATTGAKKWQFPSDDNIGAIISSPVISDGFLYFGSVDGCLYALNAETGKERWTYPFETGDKIWSSPVVDNGTVYVGSSDNKLYAVDSISGNELWSFSTEGAIIGSSIVSDGIVYVGSFDNHIYAIDATNGKELWNHEGEDWFWAQPVINNGVIYAAGMASDYLKSEGHPNPTLYALDARTGALQWTFLTEGAIHVTPIIINDYVIVSSKARKSTKIHVVDTKNGNEINSFPLQRRDDKSTPVLSPLCAKGNTIYLHIMNISTEKANDKEWAIYSLDIVTGEKKLIYAYPLQDKS